MQKMKLPGLFAGYSYIYITYKTIFHVIKKNIHQIYLYYY